MSNFTKLMQQAAAGVGGGDFYPYTIDNSVRFNPGDSPYLSRSSYSCSRTTWTVSFWLKRSDNPETGTYNYIFDQGTTSGTGNQQTYFYQRQLTANYDYVAPTSFYATQADYIRDLSAWYHFVLVWDSTNATSTDRIRIYKNGVRSNLSASAMPSQNHQGQVGNSAYPFYIGRYSYSVQYNLDGYLADWHFIDGQALDSSYFGETKNGVWIPKSYSGTYSGNSYHLDFADSSDLGKDVSGNANHFTSSGLTSSDQMTDTPTNNFPTWNPLLSGLASGTPTLSNGNLDVLTPGAGSGHTYATMAIPESGDWYWEVTWNTGTYWLAGIAAVDRSTVYSPLAKSIMYHSNGFFYEDATSHSGYTAASTGDVVGIRANVDAGTVSFYLNNTLLDTFTYDVKGMFPQTGDASGTPGVNTISATGNFGQSSFTYTPPGTSVALCTANLPEPTIGPNIDSDDTAGLPEDQFNILLYEGNSTNDRDITGVGFDPDLGWFRNRDENYGWIIVDRNRGDGFSVGFDTGAQESGTGKFDSFITDGYRIDYHPGLNRSSIANFSWKAGGTASSNTDGTISSNVSVNSDAKISIITYTGTGASSGTVGHGLGVTPGVIIHKGLYSGTTWYYKSNTQLGGWDKNLRVEGNNALLSGTTDINNASTSTFTVGTSTSVNGSGNNFVAYAFAEVEGFSKFGKYTGNGFSDGPFVYTGFRPAFVLIKKTSAAASWIILDTTRDPYNQADGVVRTDVASAETSDNQLDFLSNGFKIRGTDAKSNTSGSTYIFTAFAENPFKYSNAR